MKKIMDEINKLSLPAVILIASIILGSFYYASELNKQKSIERQQDIKIVEEKRMEETKQLNLTWCLAGANTEYLSYMKLNGTEKADGIITALTSVWDRAEKNKQASIDNCYKQYK